MSVNYDLYETPDLAKSGEEQPLHARVVLKGSYTAEEFVEQVTVFQHMPHAQVVGVIEAISKELRHLLLKGFSVELGDIGYFSLSLSVDKKVKTGLRQLIRKLAEASAIRATQADSVAKTIAESKYPTTIVCGDFNDGSISYTHRILTQKLDDAFTQSGKGLGISCW